MNVVSAVVTPMLLGMIYDRLCRILDHLKAGGL